MKTWQDIEVAAITNPLFRYAVTAVELGRATREEALIVVSLGQAELIQKIHDEIVNRVASAMPVMLVVK